MCFHNSFGKSGLLNVWDVGLTPGISMVSPLQHSLQPCQWALFIITQIHKLRSLKSLERYLMGRRKGKEKAVV